MFPPAPRMYDTPGRSVQPGTVRGKHKVMPVVGWTCHRRKAAWLISEAPMAASSGLHPVGLMRFPWNRCQHPERREAFRSCHLPRAEDLQLGSATQVNRVRGHSLQTRLKSKQPENTPLHFQSTQKQALSKPSELILDLNDLTPSN